MYDNLKLMSRIIFLSFVFIFSLTAARAAQEKAAPSLQGDEGKAYIYSGAELFNLMDDAEREYYDQMFDYVMGKTSPNTKYEWKSYASSGEITPGQPVAGKGTVCRQFKERVNFAGKTVNSLGGMGCKRVGADGWCRLPKNDMLSCAMEAPRGAAARAARDLSDVVNSAKLKANDAGNKVRATQNDVTSSWWWPF